MWSLLKNLFWLNLRKLKQNVFWRVLFVLINLVLFSTSLYKGDGVFLVPIGAFWFVFLLATLGVTLFLYTKYTGDLGTVSLYRSLGASKIFVVLNHLVEVLILYFAALILFVLVLIFARYNGKYFLYTLLEFGVMVVETVIFSLHAVARAEKMTKVS